tara:strand:+ start:228 stop:437 length:210 start_codon:yes stop_codon:yes gene_type:complete
MGLRPLEFDKIVIDFQGEENRCDTVEEAEASLLDALANGVLAESIWTEDKDGNHIEYLEAAWEVKVWAQ